MAGDVKKAGPFRLVATLGLAGFFSGLIIVTSFVMTQPRILRNQAEAMEAAIYTVVPGSVTRKIYVVKNDKLEPFEEKGGAMPMTDAVFGAYDDAGKLVGYGIPAEGAGFQDTIKLIYGFDPVTRKVIGMQVLESRETPGLGDKIIKDQKFLDNFSALEIEPEVVSVKAGTKTAANQVDSISGATISSKAVVSIINAGNERYLPMVDGLKGSEEKQ